MGKVKRGYKTLIDSKLKDLTTRNNRYMSVGVAGIVFLGLMVTFFSSAASTPVVNREAEDGTVSAPASKITDGSASGGNAVKFGSGVSDDANLPYWGTPVMRDEFNGSSIDTAKWNVRDRSDLGLLPDAGVVDRNEVSVSGGLLHVHGDWLDRPVETSSGPSSPDPTERWHKEGYIDQRVLNTGDTSFQQHYGRWEIRAKMPTGPQSYGALAAFWLRSAATGEIDIVESWGFNTAPTSNGQFPGGSTLTIHSNTMGPGSPGYQKVAWRINQELNDYSDTQWSYISNNLPLHPAFSQFHTWAFEYTPTYAAGYYDGQQFMRTTPDETPWLWQADYFGQPFHIRLNLHVGPSVQYWGLPDPNHKDWTQPLDYQVDYVRAWAYPG